MEESDWDTCFNFNVKSHLFLFHAAKPHLEKSEGSFTSVASVAGVTSSGSSIVSLSLKISKTMKLTFSKAYSVTKAAQLHLMKALAKISGPHIRVNSISPGLLLTASTRFPPPVLANFDLGMGQ